MWNPDTYIKAWNFASIAHGQQFVPGTTIPYLNHVGLVAMEVMTAITQCDHIASPDLAIACALLHDTLEDTNITYENLKSDFGQTVANGVLALTKNKTLPKETRMIDSLARIKMQPPEIAMVKLADRITNLQPPPSHWSFGKINNYRNEARTILIEIGSANQYLRDRLRAKIECYGQHV